MKRTCLLILASLLLFSLAGVASAAEPTELTFVNYDVPTSLSGILGIAIEEEIAKHTDGKVKVKTYWGTSLLKGAEALEGVEDGVVDMAIVNPNYYPNKLPLNGVYATFVQGPESGKALMWLYKVIFDRVPELRQEVEKYNQIPLIAFSVMPKTVASTKPIASIADFKGKKMRAANRWGLGQLEAAGAIPVSVPWNDCYMALQTGTIDAVYTNHDSIHGSKLDEVGPNVFYLKPLWSGTKFMITINKNTWDRFSRESQDKIKAAFDVVEKRYIEAFDTMWQEVADKQKELGYTINYVTLEEVEEFVKMPKIIELQETWIKEREAEGMKNAREVFEKVRETLNEALEMEKK